MMKVYTPESMNEDNQVVLTMSRADAERLFHSINRTMELLDEYMEEAPRWKPPIDVEDQAAYDRANEFIATLQQELQIEPA
jgi:hypothetical protein